MAKKKPRAYPYLATRDGVDVRHSVHRGSGLHFFKLLGQQIVRRHLPVSGSFDGRKMLVRDGLSIDPLGNSSLSDSHSSSKLVLTANDIDCSFNSAHGRQISGDYNNRQYRRYFETDQDSISVPNMGSDNDAKRSKPTAADQLAAARLRAIHEKTPKGKRPRQQDIADALGVSQAAISHYMHGRLAIGFTAAVTFAEFYHCHPEDIRDDLPEMQAAKAYLASNPHSDNADERELDAVWFSYSMEKKKTLLGMERLAAQLANTGLGSNVNVSSRYHKKRESHILRNSRKKRA